MTINTILFDLDGTLYPNNNPISAAIDVLMTRYVQRLLGLQDPQEAIKLRQSNLAKYGMTLNWLIQEHGIDPDDYMRFCHNIDYHEFFQADNALNEQLATLQGRKIIFTNAPSEHAETVLSLLGIRQHFEQIFDIRYNNWRGKPHKEAYTRLLDAIACRAHECVLIEDSARNLPVAKELGMSTIFIGNGPIEAADFVADSIYKALPYIQKLQEQTASPIV
jgi:pyrimidine 5''-nucleotidase